MADAEQKPLESTLPEQAAIMPAVIDQGAERVLLIPEELPAQPSREVFPPWSAWDAAAVLCFTLASVFLFSMIALGLGHVLTRNQHVPLGELATNPIVVIGSQIAAYPIVIFFMMVLVRGKARDRFWPAIRWNWPSALVPAFLLGGMGFALAVEFGSRWLPIPKSLPMDKLFTNTAGAYLMAAFGVTLAPLLEELFFRGMLYPLLRRAWGVTVGVIVTGGAFAGIHAQQLGYSWGPMLTIFAVGVVFTLVRERTNSVAASFLAHCGYNFALFSTLWAASDHFRHLENVLS